MLFCVGRWWHVHDLVCFSIVCLPIELSSVLIFCFIFLFFFLKFNNMMFLQSLDCNKIPTWLTTKLLDCGHFVIIRALTNLIAGILFLTQKYSSAYIFHLFNFSRWHIIFKIVRCLFVVVPLILYPYIILSLICSDICDAIFFSLGALRAPTSKTMPKCVSLMTNYSWKK